jgi:hydrogenase expression/formation protein HypC
MCLAVPGCIEAIYTQYDLLIGKVNFGGVLKEVCLAYMPEARVGDYCLVHVGFAISRIDEKSARETLKTFEELGILQEELEELKGNLVQQADGEQKSCFVVPSEKDSA